VQWTGDLPTTRTWLGVDAQVGPNGELLITYAPQGMPQGIITAQPNDWLVKDDYRQQLLIYPNDYFIVHYETA